MPRNPMSRYNCFQPQWASRTPGGPASRSIGRTLTMKRKIQHKDTFKPPTPSAMYFSLKPLLPVPVRNTSIGLQWKPTTDSEEEARNLGSPQRSCFCFLDKFACRFEGPNAPSTLEGSVDG
uniref:Uncharacterized protein n=1 Tax=Steinernema glaseri TaxID=37863 RepID=A0A1I7ZUV0_9BILA